MGKRNTFWARNSNSKVRSKDKGSDESDEDYVISDEDEEESEADLKEEYASSVDGEPSFDGFDGSDAVEADELDEVEEEDVMLRNVEWPKVKTGPRGNRKITGCKSRKMNQVVSDNEDVDLDDADDEEEEIRNSRKAVGKVGSLDGEKHSRIGLGTRRRVFYEIEDEDGDYPEEDGEEEEERDVENVDLNSLHDGEDGMMALEEQDNVSHETEKEDDGDYEDEDGDEDFTADEDVSLDEEEEEETVACNKKSLKVCKKNKRKRRSGEGRKRRKKCSVAKTRLTRGRKRRGKNTNRGVDEDDDDFVDDCLPARKKAKTKSSRPRRRRIVPSDSDIASSAESDYEYTISEEEREQIIEAGSLLRSSVKHASSIRQTTVNKDLPQLRKPPVKKGEKKVKLVKRDVIKNVCGICLSEEDMRRLKGTLDCCSHYFCFTCIMEWSKVESRCPLCKQRFRTISKPARSTPGVDLREVVITVPERDQVYQPTEEELRSYLDPYENIICTECHQGDDDGLMLLCDLCDSSAHTYCVGLGREVPEGNWYCEGCRPVALGSANSQTHNTSEQQRVSGFYSRPSPLVVSGQYQDASLLVSPRTPFFNGENLFSPRLPNGDVQGSSPSGLGATTLSSRRTLHRHIQNIINSDRLINMGARTGGTSIANSSDGFVTTQVGHGRTIDPSQPAASQETGVSLYTISEERLPDNNSLISAHNPGLLSPKLDEFGSQEAFRRLSNNTFLGERPIDLGLCHGLAQGDPLFGNQQHLHSYMPNTMSSMAGERLPQRVKAHLKNLSSQIDLGQTTFDEISTCSMHTILAACGLEHKSSEVHLVPPPVTCTHHHMIPGSSSSSSSSSLMKGCCYSCFDSFVEDVVKMILDTRQPHWLRLGLH
ncbi:Zinc finger RING-type [Arabidopsis suecica]|uniref:Zinc finger RING-type n=1 Tax=Arabidopsis suecica TaxID=45249 RepID=A0A8T2B233_ARASU|nr:Zinc finger RING-type [Arabidopsis suecica]KAG7580825.1 Zinc finger RING-type [Arabidopsis suecica]